MGLGFFAVKSAIGFLDQLQVVSNVLANFPAGILLLVASHWGQGRLRCTANDSNCLVFLVFSFVLF